MSALLASLPPDYPTPPALLQTLLDVSLTALGLLRPVYAAGTGELTDFAFDYLNAAGQRLTGLPQQPAGTLRTRFPHAEASGALAFCCRAFETGEAGHYDFYYPTPGVGDYYRLAARRSGPLLVLSFLDPADHRDYRAHDTALRQSQAREQAARAEAAARRHQLHAAFSEAPACIAILAGPTHVFTLANPLYEQLFGNRPLVGKAIAEALPELQGQPFFGLLDEVYRTGETYYGSEQVAYLDRTNSGRLDAVYFNFTYQATHDAAGAIAGVLIFAYDVTEQVLARHQVQVLNEQLSAANEELAAANEELQAANEEFLVNNADLAHVQQELRLLNADLETRVADRTEAAQAARAEAERQQQRLARFFQQAPAAICILDGPELVYELVNAGYQALFPGRELLGRPLLDALPELTGQPVWHTLRQVYATGETHEETNIHIPIARHEGGQLENFYFHYIQQARYDEQGRIDGVLVFALDITEQVLAQQRAQLLQADVLAAAQYQARQREAFYQIFEQTPAAICIQRGPEHRYEYFNAAYQNFFPGRELHGRPVAEALPETVAAGFVAALDEVYRTGNTYFGHEAPLTMAGPDGQPVRLQYFTFTYQAFRENGEIVGISTFAYDVTEQVLGRQRQEAQQQQLHALFEQAPVAIAVMRVSDYVIEVANPPMATLWGRTPGQVVGRPLLEALPEMREQGFTALIDQVVATGEAFVAQEATAMLLRDSKLEEVYLNFVYQPLRDALGRITSVAAVATEVSEQVAARRQVQQLNEALQANNNALNEANQQLTRTNVDLDNFIYTASHDLKAPITNIEGLLSALQADLPPWSQPGEVPYILELMQGAVQRFKTTLDHLSDVTKLQKEHDQPSTDVPLAAMVEAVRLDLLPQLTEAGAELTVEVGACPTVSFAAKNLRSVIYNLLSNALKYRHPARPPRIRLGCRAEDDYTVLWVQDNGLGIEPAQLPELFTMFRRLHNHVEGSGLGLYMVKRTVENAGGKVAVASELGVGSTFSVYFRR